MSPYGLRTMNLAKNRPRQPKRKGYRSLQKKQKKKQLSNFFLSLLSRSVMYGYGKLEDGLSINVLMLTSYSQHIY